MVGPSEALRRCVMAADRMSARHGAARSVQSSSDQDNSSSAPRAVAGSWVRSQKFVKRRQRVF